MKNYFEKGETLVVPAVAAAVAAGDPIFAGIVAGVAVNDAESGDDVVAVTEGVVELPKDAAAITQGAQVYWNATDKVATVTASDNSYLGAAWYAAAAGDTTVRVKLNA
jgi:predicted RecA/RadA family phage recombinase